MKKERFTLLWEIIDLFVRIITAVAVLIIISNNMQGIILTILVIIFIIWAFRPFIIALKEYMAK